MTNINTKCVSLNILYLVNLILNVLALKALGYYFDVKEILFSSLIFGISFPFIFAFFIYKKMQITILDLVLGIIDNIQLVLLFIGISHLNIAEYISLRTFSLIFNTLLSYFFLLKYICVSKIIGNIIILSCCISLISLGGVNNILYSSMIFISSLFYSIIAFCMEKYSKSDNFVQIKLISTFISMVTYLIYDLVNNNINKHIYANNTKPMFWLLILFLSASEIIYFVTKFYLIKITNNGSVYTNILDIVRRVITLIIGIFLFKDKYPTYIFICFGFLIIGCIFINFSDGINKLINKIKCKKNKFLILEQDVEILPVSNALVIT
jgi:drug/metabolite transporter (DMT)-like permease